MTTEEINLTKRFHHYVYDHSGSGPRRWWPDCSTFEEAWRKHILTFDLASQRPKWEQRCKIRGLTQFAPYTPEAIELKLTIYGY